MRVVQVAHRQHRFITFGCVERTKATGALNPKLSRFAPKIIAEEVMLNLNGLDVEMMSVEPLCFPPGVSRYGTADIIGVHHHAGVGGQGPWVFTVDDAEEGVLMIRERLEFCRVLGMALY